MIGGIEIGLSDPEARDVKRLHQQLCWAKNQIVRCDSLVIRKTF